MFELLTLYEAEKTFSCTPYPFLLIRDFKWGGLHVLPPLRLPEWFSKIWCSARIFWKPVQHVGVCPPAFFFSLFIPLTSNTIINNHSRLICSIHLPGVRALDWVSSAVMCPCRILRLDRKVAITHRRGLFLLTKATQRHKIRARNNGFIEPFFFFFNKKGKTRLNQEQHQQIRVSGANLCISQKMKEAF